MIASSTGWVKVSCRLCQSTRNLFLCSPLVNPDRTARIPSIPAVLLCPPHHIPPDSTLTYGQPAKGLRYDPTSQVTTILHQLTATSTQINQAAYAYNRVGDRTTGESVVNVENGG